MINSVRDGSTTRAAITEMRREIQLDASSSLKQLMKQYGHPTCNGLCQKAVNLNSTAPCGVGALQPGTRRTPCPNTA